MDREKYHSILQAYIPEASITGILDLLEQYPTHLIITRERITKQGDFKILRNGQSQITVNHNLNPYNFLLTLVHEIAHLVVHRTYKRVKPHGQEWKNTFRSLMLPFINNAVFPNDLLPYLAQYFINPKAATGSDIQLSIALKKYDAPSDKKMIYELKEALNLYSIKEPISWEKKEERVTNVQRKTPKKYIWYIKTQPLQLYENTTDEQTKLLYSNYGRRGRIPVLAG